MGELSKQINIGEVLEQQLNQTGIETFEQLKSTGSRQAWLNIKTIDPSSLLQPFMRLRRSNSRYKMALFISRYKGRIKVIFINLLNN